MRSMKGIVLSSLITIMVLLAFNFLSYKFMPAKNSVIKQKSRLKYETTSPKTGLGSNSGSAEIPDLRKKRRKSTEILWKSSSSSTSKEPEVEEDIDEVKAFKCSDDAELYNRYRYEWKIIDRDFCTKKYPDLLLLFVAITALEQRENRNLIRKTWGDVKLYKNFKTTVIFPLGQTDDPDVMQLIENEQKLYGDILQQNFLDTYKNLTLKSLMWLQFVHDFCPNVKYVLKIDNDITFNYFKLLGILRYRTQPHYYNRFSSKTFSCSVTVNAVVHRNDSKWPVSIEEYPASRYPRYCSGSFYLLTGDLIRPLFEQARFCTLFWIEDVHITGHLGLRVHAIYENWERRTVFAWNQLEKLIENHHKLFAIIYTPWDNVYFWKRLRKHYGYNDDYKKI